MWACFTSVGVVGETDAAVYSKKRRMNCYGLPTSALLERFGLMMIIRWKKKKKGFIYLIFQEGKDTQ